MNTAQLLDSIAENAMGFSYEIPSYAYSLITNTYGKCKKPIFGTFRPSFAIYISTLNQSIDIIKLFNILCCDTNEFLGVRYGCGKDMQVWGEAPKTTHNSVCFALGHKKDNGKYSYVVKVFRDKVHVCVQTYEEAAYVTNLVELMLRELLSKDLEVINTKLSSATYNYKIITSANESVSIDLEKLVPKLEEENRLLITYNNVVSARTMQIQLADEPNPILTLTRNGCIKIVGNNISKVKIIHNILWEVLSKV